MGSRLPASLLRAGMCPLHSHPCWLSERRMTHLQIFPHIFNIPAEKSGIQSSMICLGSRSPVDWYQPFCIEKVIQLISLPKQTRTVFRSFYVHKEVVKRCNKDCNVTCPGAHPSWKDGGKISPKEIGFQSVCIAGVLTLIARLVRFTYMCWLWSSLESF